MDERPVRLNVSDDLRRGRGSVFFRVWFALPFLVWLAIWAVAAFFVAIANWAVTLAMGRSHEPLHRFLARFVRCTTHVLAYLNLAAETLPSFDGKPGYPIDVEIDPPRRQNRWSVGFRIVLAVPALLLLGVFFGSSSSYLGTVNPALSLGLVGVAAFLGWFVGLVHGRMPRGMRDLIAYGISYGAQLWAYLLLLTDRYPSSDPLTAIGPLPTRDDPVQLEADDDLRRSRLTVFFRLLLALPHLIWLTLWGVAALLAAIANWIAALVTGISPEPLHRFLAAYVRYQLHVAAYLYLIGNPFPGFTGAEGSYPIELRVAERARQNRWAVLFRSVLALPALLIASVYGVLAFTVAVLGWFAALFTGRMPLGLRNAGALALRYGAQTNGYLLFVTGSYPYSGPSLSPPSAAATPEPPVALPPAV
jgi:hypothetical protein